MISLRWGSATDTGQVRNINQDAALVAETVFAVADGMGGHAAGEVASQVAVQALRAAFEPTYDGVLHAVRSANQAVLDKADDDPELRGMGTTMTALALVPDGDDGGGTVFAVANVGDSRAYRYRSGELTQVTRDHSLVEDLVQEGRLPPEEARSHPQRNILTRVLGNEVDVEVDGFKVAPLRGDRLLLCSDGLFNELDDDRIAAVLRRLADPDDAAGELVRLANEAGGHDNITVVVVDVVDDGGQAQQASSALAGDRKSRRRATAATAVVEPTERLPAVEAPSPRRVADEEEEVEDRPSRKERRDARRRARRSRPGHPRRLTWRSFLFVVVLLLLIAGAVGAVHWFARSTFYVGTTGEDQVAIFRGRPGGVLWIEPTLERRTDLTLAQVPPARRADVNDGRQVASIEAAERYIDDVLRVTPGRPRRLTTTTTASTATTLAPPAGTQTP